MTRASVARQIVQVCQRLHDRGLIAGPDGNVSVRLSSSRVLATPAGMSKVDVRAADLVEVSLGRPAARAPKRRSGKQVSSEIAMHLRIYQRRPDVNAVVHAHPPTATGFAVAGEDFMAGVLPEVILQMGGVPLVPYATPGTEALPDAMEPFLQGHDAFLLANHGATTVGATLTVALQRMESLEHAARIILVARTLGRVQSLTPAQVSALRSSRSE